MDELPNICERCGEKLKPTNLVFLQLNSRTSLYTKGGAPEAEDQGWFMFGKTCAATVLREGGELSRIHRLRRRRRYGKFV